MKIIADQQIPLLQELFGSNNLITLPATQILPENVKDAEILLVRSVTRVNAELLKGSSVKLVGTASAGFDHLDISWLEQNKIIWKHAPGSNAVAVGEYVLACIAALRQNDILPKKLIRAGIIGVGNTGSQTLKYLSSLGFQVLCNDPPRALRDSHFYSHSFDDLMQCDLICLHLPLIKNGPFPTHHLINQKFLEKIKPGCIILNAGRGNTIDSQAVLNNEHLKYCFDVWENEPTINLDILDRCILATPHIAGHSIEAKLRATLQLYQAIRNHYLLPELPQNFGSLITTEAFSLKTPLQKSWENEILNIFNPMQLTRDFKRSLLNLRTEQNSPEIQKSKIGKIFTEFRNSHSRHEIGFNQSRFSME